MSTGHNIKGGSNGHFNHADPTKGWRFFSSLYVHIRVLKVHNTKEFIQALEGVGAQYTTYLQAHQKSWGFETLLSVSPYSKDENKM